jgi:vacuolar-type H+-ATPase subunit I/STV1
MAAHTIFSCKGLGAKQSIALQILGYTTISIIAEKFEQVPQADIKTFTASEQTSEQLNNFVESVNICPELWGLVRDSAPASEIFFAKILEMDGDILSQSDFDSAMNNIQSLLKESEAPFRIIDELFTNEAIVEERLNTLKTIIEKETEQIQTQKPEQTNHTKTQRQARSKTFRANGRRALTPMRRRRKIPETK